VRHYWILKLFSKVSKFQLTATVVEIFAFAAIFNFLFWQKNDKD